MSSYRHTQPGFFSLAACVLSGAAGALLLLNTGHWLLAIGVLAVEAVVAALFSSLTVEVGHRELRWHYGPGLWRYRVPLTAIREIAVVRNRWWHGLGLHRIGGVKLYTVSGLDAVEITLGPYDIRRIGTDDPHGLAAAIRAAVSWADDQGV